MERLAIVGLPNAGKSSLFNALTGAAATVAAHPFSTTETNVGVAEVADPRLAALAEMSRSKKVVPATAEFVDIAALVAGSATGEGLGNRFLGGIREVDAMVNLGEDQLADADTVIKPVQEEFGGAAEVLGMSVQLEAEAAQLDPSERAELLEGLGLGEGALPRVVRAAYHLLGRRTFLTTGDKESRAWTFPAGAKAPECAGVIHTDLQRGFIRAEVIRWDELVEIGSWQKAKDVGRLRVEGKDYEVQDGDVLEIRFNV